MTETKTAFPAIRGVLLAGALSLLLPSAPPMADDGDAPAVSAPALFKDKALLIIGGENRLLKVGETSPEGVTLISSNSREAVVEINGERSTVLLGNKIISKFKERAPRSIQITPSEGGHYFINGNINGLNARFLLDTGATHISLSGDEAERLGLEYKHGKKGFTSTASGQATAYQIKLNRVRVGDIEKRDISAVVLEGPFPEIILLGNSFLDHLNITREGKIMRLSEQ